MNELLRDRHDAGKRLARRLSRWRTENPPVLALPRGGVPVAAEIARALGAPLEVFVARKIGAPTRPEFGVGAIAEGGGRVLDEHSIHSVDATRAEIERTIAAETEELERRVRTYRQGRPLPELTGRTVLLVDDGIATGGTARAAVQGLRRLGARKIIVVAPVAAAMSAALLATEADDVVCLDVRTDLRSIGRFYVDFDQVEDAEVLALLAEARASERATKASAATANGPQDVAIRAGNAVLEGVLDVPSRARGIVVFVHGSGSSRRSPRNRSVARALNEAGLATLLFDLLTLHEEAVDDVDASLRFDIGFLADRLLTVTDWVGANPSTSRLPLGYFGASTGAGAALVAAAERRTTVRAIVSRGGRPDLAGTALERVAAPTLLVVGGRDPVVIDLNREAAARMRCETSVVVVPGATHLFGEPGALEQVATLARDWFVRYLERGAVA